MNSQTISDRLNMGCREVNAKTRTRQPLPPLETRDWMTPGETALVLGCSVATVHRLRRGLIPGLEPLPCSQYGRKCIFRKTSVARWREHNEKGRLAA
jgi:Helix-turn-helix domain